MFFFQVQSPAFFGSYGFLIKQLILLRIGYISEYSLEYKNHVFFNSRAIKFHWDIWIVKKWKIWSIKEGGHSWLGPLASESFAKLLSKRMCIKGLRFTTLLLYWTQFYIQLLYRPHLGTWILLSGLLGRKRKNSEATEFLLKYI